MKRSINLLQKNSKLSDVGQKHINADELAVVNCTILITVWANPFDERKKLDGLSSNFEESEQVKNDLFEVEKVGKK